MCKHCQNSGENNPFYGKKHNKETKNKISKTQKESGWATGKNNPFYGKKHNQETIENIKYKIKQKTDSMTKEEKIKKYDSGWWKNIKNTNNIQYYGKEKAEIMLKNQLNNQNIYWHNKTDNELNIIKNKISKTQKESGKTSGIKNPMSIKSIAERNNCLLKDAHLLTPNYGKQHSIETKNKLRISHLGKISPEGSGRGISGWILSPRIYFRSSYELSYFLFLIKNNINFKSAENAEYKILYFYKGIEKYHYSDIIINNTKMVEIKPENRLHEEKNVIKLEAAKKWCAEHNFSYEVVTENNIEHIYSQKEILDMDGLVIELCNRWRKKLNEKYR